MLPDVKPMLGEGDNGQAFPVAVVANIPQELMSMRAEDLEVDKDGQPKDKDKQQDNGAYLNGYLLFCFFSIFT